MKHVHLILVRLDADNGRRTSSIHFSLSNPSSFLSGQPNVPLLVKLCCTIIEEIGLETIGIYRIPGNSAGINYLTEQVSKVKHFSM